MEPTTMLWSAGVLILAVTLVWAVSQVKRFTQKGREAVQGKPFDATLTSVLTTVDSLLETATNTIIVELKEKTQDGVLTSEEINEIVMKLKQEALLLIGKDAQPILIALVGDYEKWLDTLIRARVTTLAKEQLTL